MADTSITPYGYIYGKDPKANHPFWGGSGPDIEEYVKSLNGTVTETEDGKIYTINATDGDDVVTKVIDILVPNQEDVGTYAEEVTVTSNHANNQTTYTIKYTTSDEVEHTAGTVIVPDTPTIPEIPTDYVTSVVIGHTETATSDTYAFKYVTKDGIEHNMGSVFVSKNYVNSVSVTQTTASGVNTVTVDVDGTQSSFDVPVAYLKSVTQSAGQHDDDLYTFTDENGHTTQISAPGQYLQSANVTINGGSTELSARGVVGSSAATSRLMNITMTAAEDHPDNLNEIVITNAAGDTSTLQWGEGGINQILGKVDGFINIRWPQTNKRYVGIMANVYSVWNETESLSGVFEAHSVFPKPAIANYTKIIVPAKWALDSTVQNYVTKNTGYENDTITATTHYDAYIIINWPTGNESPIFGGVLLKPYILLNNTTKNIKEVIQCEALTVTNYMSNTLNIGVVS